MPLSKCNRHFGIAGLAVVGWLACGCTSQVAPPAMGPPEVATVTVRQESVLLTTQLPGRTSAYLVAEIRPQVNGLIQKLSLIHI